MLLKKNRQTWATLDPALSPRLADARLQLHHAAQFVSGMGVSYLPHKADDSHTSMTWFAGTLASNPVGSAAPVRLGLRPHPFELVLLGADAPIERLTLNGVTRVAVENWIRRLMAKFGLDPDAFVLPTHYKIPPHPVDGGVPFDAGDDSAFVELGRWFADAALILGGIARGRTDASPVRCWPHHFDIATLITVADAKSMNVGMEPGDAYYDEPYWYVSPYPAPSPDAPREALDGGGTWHTREWIGAVLPGSRLEAAREETQIAAFLNSGVRACTKLLFQ